MKRLLAVLLLVIPMTVFSQSNLKFNTTDYAFAQVDAKGYYHWDSWKKCNVQIVINLDKDIVTIYSNVTQYYYIYDTYNDGNPYPDTKGGYQIKFYMVDQDGDKGSLRLRVGRHGDSQIYIDFKDCAWCYNVYKK
jgi:hypothetical protein